VSRTKPNHRLSLSEQLPRRNQSAVKKNGTKHTQFNEQNEQNEENEQKEREESEENDDEVQSDPEDLAHSPHASEKHENEHHTAFHRKTASLRSSLKRSIQMLSPKIARSKSNKTKQPKQTTSNVEDPKFSDDTEEEEDVIPVPPPLPKYVCVCLGVFCFL
jgi:hypothetical protein